MNGKRFLKNLEIHFVQSVFCLISLFVKMNVIRETFLFFTVVKQRWCAFWDNFSIDSDELEKNSLTLENREGLWM